MASIATRSRNAQRPALRAKISRKACAPSTSETAERFGRTFTEKYPGVKVNVVRTTAQVAYQRLSQDIQANVANCDVFGSTDVGHYVQLKERKLLMKYVPAT